MFQKTGNEATCCEQIRCASEVYTPVVQPYDSQGSVSIPKILHTIGIYPEGFKKAKLIEEIMEIQYAMAKFEGWSIMSWGLEEATSLIATKYSFFLPIWQEIGHWRGGNPNIARSDIFRNFAIHAYGGLYLDSDMLLCHTTLNDLVKDQFRSKHNVATFYYTAPKSRHVNNAIYSASPSHAVFEVCIDEMQRNLMKTKHFSMDSVGPGMLASCIVRYAAACSAPVPNFREGQGLALGPNTVPSFTTFGDIRFAGRADIVGNTPGRLVWHLGAGTWIHKKNSTAERSLCMKKGEDSPGCMPFATTCPNSWKYYVSALKPDGSAERDTPNFKRPKK